MYEATEENRELDDGREEGAPGGGLALCLGALAALNLVVLMVVAQLPITAPGLEQVARFNRTPGGEVYLREEGTRRFHFQSCTGGESVNCHRTGNRVGL